MRNEFDNRTIVETLNASDLATKFIGTIESAKIIEEQTMHQVYRVVGSNSVVYVKVGKPNDKDKGEREMRIEAGWYNKFKDKLKLPDAPEAIYIAHDGNHFVLIGEVVGPTYQDLLNQAKSDSEKIGLLEDIIKVSAKIAVDGANLNRNEPGVHPAFFGGFNAGEAGFLNNRTLKNLPRGLTDAKHVEAIGGALQVAAPELTNPDNWLFYRDATPLNWIKSQNGNVVPVDLGSTSYRPVGLEIVALIETPGTGIEHFSEDVRLGLRGEYRIALEKTAVDTGSKVQSPEYFETLFHLSSLVKNASGIASRMIHIDDTIAKIVSTQGEEKKMYEKRLPANIEGRDFHIQRAYVAAGHLMDMGYQANKIEPAYVALKGMADKSSNVLKTIEVSA